MVWYSHLSKNFPQFVVIHTVEVFGIVTEAEVGVFLEFPCFFCDPVDIGNLISGSSAFSKSSLITWKLVVHVLLEPSLKDFEYSLLTCKERKEVKLLSHVLHFAIPWSVSYQAPSIHGILQARILEWVAFPSPGDLPDPGFEPQSPVL